MNGDPFTLVSQNIAKTLRRWQLSEDISAEEFAACVQNGVCYYERELEDRSSLALVRFFSPIVHREDIFLGSVLLNEFMSKAVIRAVENHGLGRIVLLADDLERYYFLYHRQAPLELLVDSLRLEILEHLADLYFGDEDPANGIYGAWQRLFTFTSSQFEPFPVYAVPQFLAQKLERAVRQHVRTMISGEAFSSQLSTITSALAFFYGQNSGSYGDAQSFPMFLFRLVDHYQVLSSEQVTEVLGLETVTKTTIKDALDPFLKNKQPITEKVEKDLRMLFETILTSFETDIEQGGETWFLGFIRSDQKLIELSPEAFFTEITRRVELGYHLVSTASADRTRTDFGCRLCGRGYPLVRKKCIIAGLDSFRFLTKNPQLSGDAPTLCVKCALSSYLQMRILGIDETHRGISTIQVPQLYTLAFHYGQHEDHDAARLAATIDETIRVLTFFRQQAKAQKRSFSVEYVREQIRQHPESLAQAGVSLSSQQAWNDLSADDTALSGTDVLRYMSTRTHAQVLPLGTGDFRLFAFVFPHLPNFGKGEKDFVQDRFSQSRLAAFTLLALLRKLCGCTGPYYFQSVPRISPGAFDPNRFFVRGKPESVERVLTHYGMIVNVARRVTKPRPEHSALADWILLAERIEADPFPVLSEILRRSPRRREDFQAPKRDTFQYYSLAGPQTIDATKTVDGTAYLQLLKEIRDTKGSSRNEKRGGDTMPKTVDTKLLDEFCVILFRALDSLSGGIGGTDFLPFFLDERPNAYERYPRLLFDCIRNRNDVEAGYKEWATKILRDANAYQREKEFEQLLSVKQWLIEHRSLFENRTDNLAHLKRSLFFLSYDYLAPRRRLTTYYANANAGKPEALSAEVIKERFGEVTREERARLAKIYGEGEQIESIYHDALSFLLANNPRYRWKEKTQKNQPGTIANGQASNAVKNA